MYSYYCPLVGNIPFPLCYQCLYSYRYQFNHSYEDMKPTLMNTDIHSNNYDDDIKIYIMTRENIDVDGCSSFENRMFKNESFKESFTNEEAIEIGKKLDIQWDYFDTEEFRLGLNMELEHGNINQKTNITDDDPILTGKIVLAHLNKLPDYYTRLYKEQVQSQIKYDFIKNFM